MKHSVYFEGKVQSLGLNERDGFATLGVIEPGAYTFSTASEERMTVVAGVLRVRLSGKEWTSHAAGQTFIVPKGQSFEVEADADVAYLCRYR
jgi:uncharacterized protein YaiE (UPF0345 family)